MLEHRPNLNVQGLSALALQGVQAFLGVLAGTF